MLTDAIFLLHKQLDEPRNYMAIIEAIAAGYHTLSNIAKMAGIVRSNIVKYLGVLRQLGYVERIVPATVRRPQQGFTVAAQSTSATHQAQLVTLPEMEADIRQWMEDQR